MAFMTYEAINGAPQTDLPPEWIRVDSAIRWSSLSKPTIYRLINEGKIKTACLKKRNQIRGTRLISIDSLKAYLNSIATGGESQETGAEAIQAK